MANINVGRKSGFIVRGGARRRETLWIGDTLIETTIATGTTAVLLSTLNAAALALRPFTVVRTRGAVNISSD